MKLLGVLNDPNDSKYLESGLDGFLFPLALFSCDYEKTYSIEDIKSFQSKYPFASCFVVMNKMMFQHDLELLLEVLKELNQMCVDGILFYDVSILYLVKKYDLKVPLYLHQTHFVTNKQMINEFATLGVSGAYLSNEMTKDEILEIVNHTQVKRMILLVGYPVVAMSKRKLVTNYLKNIGKDQKKDIEVIETSSKQKYFVKESDAGTTFFYGKRLNYSCCYPLLQDKIEYGIIKQDDLDSDSYCQLISYFKNFDQKKIDAMIGHNRGFLFRKTIYRVKKK